MNKKEVTTLLHSMSDKLYQAAYYLLPDDLQAEQLVIDAINAYLFKEKKFLLSAVDLSLTNQQSFQLTRKHHMRMVLRYMNDIGLKRASQLPQSVLTSNTEYLKFYGLEPKVRFVLGLRLHFNFSVEEIENITKMPKYEVIEKIHNGRYLLLNDFQLGAQG